MLVASSKQFKKFDSYVIEHLDFSMEGLILKAAKALYPYVASEKNVVIIAGKGNNGADGLALSCLLKNMAQEVTVFLMASKNEMGHGASFYLDKAMALNVPIYYLSNEEDFSFKVFNDTLTHASVIVDAIYGTGFIGNVSLMDKKIIQIINSKNNIPVLSIDVPSGLNADTGMVGNVCIKANLTVTFVAYKQGFFNPDSKLLLGEVALETLGFNADLMVQLGFGYYVKPEFVSKILKARRYDGHKGLYGRVLCVTGSPMYPGAAYISAGACLRSGAGLVQLCSTRQLMNQVVYRYPEIVLTALDATMLDVLNNKQAILFGCGKGYNEQTEYELVSLLKNARVPVILDADGINCLTNHLDLLHYANCPIILTPHMGEMQRLLVNEDEKDPVLGAIQFAKKYKTIIVLKGPLTLITDGKHVFRNSSGNKAMSTPGMGDALAGMIASFIAQGYTYLDACVFACYLHGFCGDELSKESYCVYASELVSFLPKAMNIIQNNQKK